MTDPAYLERVAAAVYPALVPGSSWAQAGPIWRGVCLDVARAAIEELTRIKAEREHK